MSQLYEYDKKFIIMGNTNALSYQEIFKLFKDDNIRTGYTNFNVGMYFFVPDDTEKFHKIVDGKKMVRVATSCWFTNLPVKKHTEKLILYKKYNPEEYPKYDNYNAININKYSDIPVDYYDYMGVPITFLDKYNPMQFKIIDGLHRYALYDACGTNEYIQKHHLEATDVNGKSMYFRVVIQRNDLEVNDNGN